MIKNKEVIEKSRDEIALNLGGEKKSTKLA